MVLRADLINNPVRSKSFGSWRQSTVSKNTLPVSRFGAQRLGGTGAAGDLHGLCPAVRRRARRLGFAQGSAAQ